MTRPEMALQYQKSDSEWAPVSWNEHIFMGRDRLLEANDLVIRKCQLNPQFDVSLFDIDFPHGTQVHDRPKNKVYRVEKANEIGKNEVEQKRHENGRAGEHAPELELPAIVNPDSKTWWERNSTWVLALTIVLAAAAIWRLTRARTR